MRSGASGAGCLDASFAVLYSALSIIAPSVNVPRRTRRKPSTIRGAAPDIVIGQSTAARAGAHPYQCYLCSPSVNVLRRTRRKPSTIRGAAPEVVIGQSTAARAGAHPYRAGEVARSYHSDSVYRRFNSNRNKGLRVGSFLVRTEVKENKHDYQEEPARDVRRLP
jgi:hypothetical protein